MKSSWSCALFRCKRVLPLSLFFEIKKTNTVSPILNTGLKRITIVKRLIIHGQSIQPIEDKLALSKKKYKKYTIWFHFTNHYGTANIIASQIHWNLLERVPLYIKYQYSMDAYSAYPPPPPPGNHPYKKEKHRMHCWHAAEASKRSKGQIHLSP